MRNEINKMMCLSNIDAGFRDVLSSDKSRGYLSKRSPLHGWSSDENSWNEKLYPVWKRGDTRWRNSWKGKFKDCTAMTLFSCLGEPCGL